MPTMSAPQLSQSTQIQTDIAAVKTACETLIASANSQMADARAVNTTASLRAANALLVLKGTARELKGRMDQAHGAVSNALLDYDPANGGGIIQAGPVR